MKFRVKNLYQITSGKRRFGWYQSKITPTLYRA